MKIADKLQLNLNTDDKIRRQQRVWNVEGRNEWKKK